MSGYRRNYNRSYSRGYQRGNRNYAPQPNGGIDREIESRMAELYVPVYLAGTTYVLGYQSRYDPCTIITVKSWYSAARSLMKSHSKGFGYKESLPHKHISEGRVIDLRKHSDLADMMMEALNNTTNTYLVRIIAVFRKIWEGNMPYYAQYNMVGNAVVQEKIHDRSDNAPAEDVILRDIRFQVPVPDAAIISTENLEGLWDMIVGQLGDEMQNVDDPNIIFNNRNLMFGLLLQMMNPISEVIHNSRRGTTELVYPSPIDGQVYEVFNAILRGDGVPISKYYNMENRATVMVAYKTMIGSIFETSPEHYRGDSIQVYDFRRSGIPQEQRPGLGTRQDAEAGREPFVARD